MEKITLTITNEVGLHARPSSMFLKEASKHKSDINIIKGDKEFNGKSIIEILCMAAVKGDEITIVAEGTDETKAIAALKELFDNNFGE